MPIDLSGVTTQPFLRLRAVIGLPPGHPLAARDVIRPADLNGLDFVALAPEDTTRKDADALFAAAQSTPRIVFETPFSSTVCAMIAAGVGVGVVNPVSAEIYGKDQLILRRFEPAIHFRTLLLTAPHSRPSRIVSACMEEFGAVARAFDARFPD